MESEKIILDKENRQIYIQKILTEYNTDVYRYLHEQRNVHIPYVKEFHEENGRLVVTEEFIQGHTLDELLTSENRGGVPVKAKSAGLDDTEDFIRLIPIRSKKRVTRILTTLVLSVLILIFWIVVMLIVLYIAGF